MNVTIRIRREAPLFVADRFDPQRSLGEAHE